MTDVDAGMLVILVLIVEWVILRNAVLTTKMTTSNSFTVGGS